ncbi:large subunit ribosomal protein LP1 [Puccinia sorghi]|uniref:Large subunit ribosomal protein LP1 n=1 Tax=Puccinia sorghi TaxID=27349 RepID=A0A0L6VCC0_9BASI|nr:large subunit ribosomal protein LP1 [Puccinia sorghi]
MSNWRLNFFGQNWPFLSGKKSRVWFAPSVDVNRPTVRLRLKSIIGFQLLVPLTTAQMAAAELASTYAALILADEGLEITADKINTLLSAAKVEIEPIWATLLAKALEGKDVKDMLSNVGAGGGAAPAAAPATAAPGAEAAAPKAEEKKKEEEKEESDDDMGFGLFDLHTQRILSSCASIVT